MTNVIDDTNRLEDAIGNAVAKRLHLYLSDADSGREIVVRKTITIPSCEGLEIIGEHLYGTRLVWKGDDSCMFERPNSRDCLFHNFTVDVQGPLGCFTRDTNLNYPTGDSRHDYTMTVPTNNQHKRIRVMGNEKLGAYRRYDVGNCDENNEAHSDVDVHVNGAHKGWVINGSQSKYHTMTNCRYFGGLFGASAVHALHGSFSWIGGGGSHAGVAFFYAQNQADTLHLHRADVDGSSRFAVIEGPKGQTGASQPVEIRGGRFMTHMMIDEDAIVMRTAGPLEVSNFQLGSGHQRVARIVYDAHHGALHVHDCMFGAFGSTTTNSFRVSSSIKRRSYNNTYHKSNGESYVP